MMLNNYKHYALGFVGNGKGLEIDNTVEAVYSFALGIDDARRARHLRTLKEFQEMFVANFNEVLAQSGGTQ